MSDEREDGSDRSQAAPLDDLRRRARAEAEANGTWGAIPTANEGWIAHVNERYDASGRAKST